MCSLKGICLVEGSLICCACIVYVYIYIYIYIYINKYNVLCRCKPLYSTEISQTQTSPFQYYEVVHTENNYVCFQTRRHGYY